eukprot:scaffold162155_cov49-Prasinocladus_malaysianus.AAC.1
MRGLGISKAPSENPVQNFMRSNAFIALHYAPSACSRGPSHDTEKVGSKDPRSCCVQNCRYA